MSSSKDKLSAKDLDDSQGKARVTMYLDMDVLNVIREEAKTLKLGYQTYINQVLREVFTTDEIENKSVTKFLLKELEALKKDVSQLKKKAS